MIFNLKTAQPEVEAMTFYIYKENRHICLILDGEIIMISNENMLGVRIDEADLFDALKDCFDGKVTK